MMDAVDHIRASVKSAFNITCKLEHHQGMDENTAILIRFDQTQFAEFRNRSLVAWCKCFRITRILQYGLGDHYHLSVLGLRKHRHYHQPVYRLST